MIWIDGFLRSLVFLLAILVHRWLPGSKGLKKSVHLDMQGVALGSRILGIWTKFHGKDWIVANFYNLHSWMGLICMSLFAAQVIWSSLEPRFPFLYSHFLYKKVACFSRKLALLVVSFCVGKKKTK